MPETENLEQRPLQEEDLIYALDIGTRSVIGMLGRVEEGRVHILAVEKQPHPKRAMMDGQIEDIAQVASVVAKVTQRLEKSMGRTLTRACVAAAGRALRMERGHGMVELPETGRIGEEQVGRLEAAAVEECERTLRQGEADTQRLFLVGYTVTQFQLDNYPMTSLLGHTGRVLEADVVATFLPGEVIDSLYAVMKQAGLEVASLTLEPIAALNAAIPAELRLLNLALVDIGAGTSDIAICRDGSVVGYTMATVAGDELTEALMRGYLVDYRTAEEIKAALGKSQHITFTDILGLEQTCEAEEILDTVSTATASLVGEVADRVIELNGGPPSALFLAGGGSKFTSLQEKMAEALKMDERRVAMAGAHFKTSAYSEVVELNDPEYTTPLGIAISAGLGLISDSYRILLNGRPAKLFRNGRLTALELLMMNGYGYRDLLGRNGKSVVVDVDGKRLAFHGEPSIPAQLRINGVEGRPSDVVHAGDQIEFVPAQDGVDRTVLAHEVLQQLDLEELWMDGEPVSPDQELPTRSQLFSQREKSIAAQTAAPIPAPRRPAAAAAAPSPRPREQQSAPSSPPETPAPAPAPVPQPPVTTPVFSAGTPEPVPATVPAAPAAPSAVERPTAPPPPQTEAEPVVVPPSLIQHQFQLNGQTLILPPKADGAPYYLMDLLQYSGIDFKHLDRPVRMLINGQGCTFQQKLEQNDQVEIRLDE